MVDRCRSHRPADRWLSLGLVLGVAYRSCPQISQHAILRRMKSEGVTRTGLTHLLLLQKHTPSSYCKNSPLPPIAETHPSTILQKHTPPLIAKTHPPADYRNTPLPLIAKTHPSRLQKHTPSPYCKKPPLHHIAKTHPAYCRNTPLHH